MVPLITQDDYRPGWPFGNAHLATTLPTLLRRVPAPAFRRQRIELADGDFLDVDLFRQPQEGAPTAVLCHGLEGNSRRQYMLGMARALIDLGWSVAAMNYRGCSGEPNRRAISYHSGATEDLHAVVTHLDRPGQPVCGLVGFSLGGNLVLKYLGEDPERVPPGIRAAVAFSVPVDLAAGGRQLAQPANGLYQKRFLRKLECKIREKAALFPDQVNPEALSRVRDLRDFDDHYTAPLSGFRDAADYYFRCSSKQFLPRIERPTLLVSAQDDPFLSPECYPVQEAEASSCLHLQMPRHGGHVGFRLAGGLYWSEQRACGFFRTHHPHHQDESKVRRCAAAGQEQGRPE